MREILFRGKSIESETNKDGRRGEWVYGGIEITRRSQPETVWIAVDEDYWYDGPLCETFEVDPETVGQYTGMKDKNGVEIFEGDICEFRSFNCRRVGVVIFNDEKCRFEILQSGDADWSLEIHEVFDLEVIGNIHDNKELMEGEGMKYYNPLDFEFSKKRTGYIKLECISCNKAVVLLARLSDGHRCRFCNGHVRPVSYVRRRHDEV